MVVAERVPGDEDTVYAGIPLIFPPRSVGNPKEMGRTRAGNRRMLSGKSASTRCRARTHARGIARS